MIELEKTYLAKSLPDLNGCRNTEIIDIYIPTATAHPKLRIRKNGGSYEITKKEPVDGDPSRQKEETTSLTAEEFSELNWSLKGKRLHKIRYFYEYKDRIAEIDVFQDELKGLVVVDFEFEDENEKALFEIPDFCLIDVTDQEFIAGGMLCGKRYADIEDNLKGMGYQKVQ